MPRKNNNLYDIYPKYSKEEIDIIVDKLSKEDKEYLKLRFDIEKNTKESYFSLDNNKRKILSILDKIKKRLERNHLHKDIGSNKVLPLYERFNKYSKEEVDAVVNTLTPRSLNLFRLRFAKDGSILESYYSLDDNTKTKISSILSIMNNKIKNGINSLEKRSTYNLYRRLKTYSKEEVDTAIKRTSLKNKKLLRLKFDNNGDVLESYYSLDDYTKHRISVAIGAIKKLLKTKRSIYDTFNKFSKEEVDLMISNLTLEEKRILRLKYDDDMYIRYEYYNLSKEEQNLIELLILKKKNVMKNKGKVKITSTTNILERYNNFPREVVINTLKKLSFEEKELLGLKFNADGNYKKSYRQVNSDTKKKVRRFLNYQLPSLIKSNIKIIKMSKEKDNLNLYIILKEYPK